MTINILFRVVFTVKINIYDRGLSHVAIEMAAATYVVAILHVIHDGKKSQIPFMEMGA